MKCESYLACIATNELKLTLFRERESGTLTTLILRKGTDDMT